MGDNDTRVELTGLRGVPERALSQALVATLPRNQAPAPWECRCSALVTLGAFVRYTDTPVGAYDEVLGIIGSRTGLRPWGNVAFMSVDSESSLVGGRTNWAMPKTLARFDGAVADGNLITGTSRPALVTVGVSSSGPLPTWLRPGLHLGAFVEQATFTLGEPRFG
jgi:hypothetical protein